MPTDFDERDHPVLWIRTLGESRDDDIAERFAFAERHLQGRARVAIIFDTTAGRPLTARHRRMWTEWLTANDHRLRKQLAGVAIVVTSAMARGVFTGVFWVWQPPMPYAFVATGAEAEAWARARLRDVGPSGPPTR